MAVTVPPNLYSYVDGDRWILRLDHKPDHQFEPAETTTLLGERVLMGLYEKCSSCELLLPVIFDETVKPRERQLHPDAVIHMENHKTILELASADERESLVNSVDEPWRSIVRDVWKNGA